MKHVKSKRIQQNRYKIDNNSPNHLIDIGFHKHYDIEEKYVYNFTILRYEKMTVLKGKITAYPDAKEIKIDVVDNNHNVYTPFYHVECGNYDEIMARINRNILNEFKKLGIKKQIEEVTINYGDN